MKVTLGVLQRQPTALRALHCTAAMRARCGRRSKHRRDGTVPLASEQREPSCKAPPLQPLDIEHGRGDRGARPHRSQANDSHESRSVHADATAFDRLSFGAELQPELGGGTLSWGVGDTLVCAVA